MKKIVVADDDKLVRDRVVCMIKMLTIPIEEIIACKNGAEAYDIVKNQKIDVLITDVDMPIMDGVSLVKEIKNIKYTPKVIVISGYNDFYYAVDLLRCGVREYLLKPVRKDDMINIMMKLENEFIEEEYQLKEKIDLLYEQIKYSLLHKKGVDDDFYNKKNFINLYNNNDDYVIICTNYIQKDTINKQFLFFSDILGHNIILTSHKYVSFLIEDKLKGFAYGISAFYNNLTLLNLALKDAINKRRDSFFMITRSLNCLNSIKSSEENEVDKVIQLIGTARFNEACKYLRRAVNRVKYGQLQLEEFQDLLALMCKKIKITYEGIIVEENIDISPLLNLYKYNTIDNYYDQLFETLNMINQKLIKEYNFYRNRIKIEEAIKYIDENYKNEINMTMVSNYVSMNYSVFSIDFKEYTGKNFVNYLKEVRLKEAKRLLNETDMKIIEISEAVGYENDKHFMKTFKIFYSVTPSEYRKNIKSGKLIYHSSEENKLNEKIY